MGKLVAGGGSVRIDIESSSTGVAHVDGEFFWGTSREEVDENSLDTFFVKTSMVSKGDEITEQSLPFDLLSSVQDLNACPIGLSRAGTVRLEQVGGQSFFHYGKLGGECRGVDPTARSYIDGQVVEGDGLPTRCSFGFGFYLAGVSYGRVDGDTCRSREITSDETSCFFPATHVHLMKTT